MHDASVVRRRTVEAGPVSQRGSPAFATTSSGAWAPWRSRRRRRSCCGTTGFRPRRSARSSRRMRNPPSRSVASPTPGCSGSMRRWISWPRRPARRRSPSSGVPSRRATSASRARPRGRVGHGESGGTCRCDHLVGDCPGSLRRRALAAARAHRRCAPPPRNERRTARRRRGDPMASATPTIRARRDAVASRLEELRAFVRARLPEAMQPSHFVTLDALPLTANGKVARDGLPEAGIVETSASDESAPRSGIEAVVAEIWRRMLGVHTVGRDDDFFALGGDSLLVYRMLLAVRAARAVEVPAEASCSARRSRGWPRRSTALPLGDLADADVGDAARRGGDALRGRGGSVARRRRRP